MEATYLKDGNILTVKPTGRLDTATSPILEKEMQPHLDGIDHVIMDFADLEYISSGGLRMLLALEQVLEDRDGKLDVLHANDYIIEVFELVGFMDVVNVIRD